MNHQITIEKTEGANVFADLRDEWQTFFAASSAAPFLSWEWLSTWHKWFGAERVPLILKAYRNGELIGLLPLCRVAEKHFGLRLTRLGFLGETFGGADYLDVIAAPENKIEILTAMFDYLQTDVHFDQIALEYMAEDSPLIGFLSENNNRQKLRYSVSETAVCPQINLEGGWENLLAQMPRAREFKRKLRKLEKFPDFELRVITSAAEAESAFERFIEFHEKRWQSRGGSEVTSHPQLINFHRDVVKVLARAGLLRFEEIWFDGMCRASIYGLENDGVFYLYNTGFDQKSAKLSPGFVLIGHCIEQAIKRDMKTFDFLRGDETYKFDWATGENKLVTARLSRRRNAAASASAIAQNIERQMRELATKILPPSALENLKNRYRQRRRRVLGVS